MGAQWVHSTHSQLPSSASAMATTCLGAASPVGRATRWPHPNNSPGTGHGSRHPRDGAARSRDPLAGLPSLPADLQLCDDPGGRVRRLDERLRKAVNRTAAVLSGLWQGGLEGVPSGAYDAGSDQLASWDSASQLQREVLFGLVERHRGFCPPRAIRRRVRRLLPRSRGSLQEERTARATRCWHPLEHLLFFHEEPCARP